MLQCNPTPLCDIHPGGSEYAHLYLAEHKQHSTAGVGRKVVKRDAVNGQSHAGNCCTTKLGVGGDAHFLSGSQALDIDNPNPSLIFLGQSLFPRLASSSIQLNLIRASPSRALASLLHHRLEPLSIKSSASASAPTRHSTLGVWLPAKQHHFQCEVCPRRDRPVEPI